MSLAFGADSSRASGRPQVHTIILLLILLVAFSLLGVPALGESGGNETVLTECQFINASGTYTLGNDLHGGGADCLVLNADDVVLDGQGYEISVDDASTAILREGDRTNVTARNLSIDGGDRSIDFELVQDGLIDNVTITNATTGIRVHGDSGRSATVSLVDVDVRDADRAISISQFSDVSADRVAVGDPAAGGALLSFDATHVSLEEVADPDGPPTGLEPVDSYVEVIPEGDGWIDLDVHYDESTAAEFDESTLSLWQDDGGGWSDLSDSTVDTEERTVSSSIDSIGTVGLFSEKYTILETCQAITESGVYVLGDDIDADGTCISIQADDVVVDGQGYSILDSTGTGIETEWGRSNVTVKHVTVDGGGDGLFFPALDGGEVHDVTLTGTANHALRFQQTSDVTVTDTRLVDNDGRGVDSQQSVDNTFSNVTIEGNGEYGVRSVDSTGTRFENGTIADNADRGYFSQNNDQSTLVDTVVRDNTNGDVHVQDGASVTAERVSIGASTSPDTTLSFTGEEFTLTAVDDPAPAPTGLESIGRYFDVTGTGFLEVDLHYEAADAADVSESTLSLWNYDEGGGEWTEVSGSSVDEANRTISASLSSFSDFGAFGSGPAYFELSSLETVAHADDGETITVEATVENTGGETATQTVEYRFNGTVENTTSVELDSGDTETVSFTHTLDADPGTYTHGVHSDDDEVTASIDVSPIQYDDQSISPLALPFGDTINATATVENVGGSAVPYNASLEVNGTSVAWANETLASGETTTVSFTYTLRSVGDHAVAIADLGPETVTVENAWSQTGYDFERTRHDPLATVPQDPIRERWNFTTGDNARSSPMVVDGVVYVGSYDGNVYAIDAHDGGELWRYETDDRVYGDPAVADGIVYVGSRDNSVYALDADDGSEVWSYETGDDVRSSPLVADGVVYVGSQDGHLYALAADTGDVIWDLETDDEIYSDPSLHDDVLYVGSRDGTLYALEAATGEEVWSVDTGGDVLSAPVVAEGRVHVVSMIEEEEEHVLSAHDITDGTEAWTFEVWEWMWASPAYAEGRLIVSVGEGGDRTVGTVDAETGERDEDWELEADVNMETPAVAGDTLVFGGNDGYVHAVDVETGDERWTYEIGDGFDSSPTVADGTVYIGSQDGRYYALEEGTTFAVTVTDTHDPVSEGEDLDVDVEVENLGNVSGSDTITLAVDTTGDGVADTDVDAVSVTDLEADATASVTLTWATGPGDEGTDIALEARSSDEFDTTTATVTLASGLRWSSAEEWALGTHERTLSDDVGDREADTVRLGYDALADGLISYWPFDEEGGTTAFDAAGNNDGSHEYSPALGEPGILGTTAYGFDGNASHVVVAHDDSLEMSAENAVTVSTWVKPINFSDEPRHPLVQKSDESYNLQLHEDDRPAFTIYDGDTWSNAIADEPLTEDTWYLITGTYDGSTARIYVDGVEEGSVSVSNLDHSGVSDLGIGKNLERDHRHFNASFDDVRIYDRPLSGTEVESLYQTTRNGTYTSAWRTTDDGSPLDVSRLGLENVSAVVDDSTHTVTATVESDVTGDGQVDEVSDPVTLESASDYDLEGLTENSTRFRLRLDLETTDPTTTPVVSRIDLTGDASQAAFFEVSELEAPPSVVQNETLSVNATVENVGDETATQTISYQFNETTVDTTTLTLDGNESQVVSFSHTADAETGTYTHGISSQNSSASAPVQVLEPAHFAVDIDETTSPVVENDTLVVDATVTNTGEVEDTQTISLETDGQLRDSESLTLEDGETETVTLEWETGESDAGNYTALVSSDDDSDSAPVQVLEPANFDISIAETTSPVVANETLLVNATVTNTGEVEDTQTISLETDGQPRDSDSLTLAGGASETVTLAWATEEGEAGNYTATVSSDDETDSTEVRVLEPANFDVSILETTSPVVANETLLVNATVTNTGEVEDTQTISLETDGQLRDSDSLTLGEGETETVTLEWATEAGDAGNYTALVSSADDEDMAEVQVLEPANFDISIAETTSPVVANETLLVNATVTNTGEVEDTQTVLLETDGQPRDSDSLTLAGGASETVTLAWATGEGDAGNYTAVVSSDDETDSAAVQVLEPAQFAVSIDETSSPVVANDTLIVNATISNTGEVEDTQTVDLDIGGTDRDSESLTLAGGENETITLEWETGEGDAGNHTALVSSDDDTDSADIRVLEPAFFDVSLDETNSPVVENETLLVNATITNTGEVEDTQTVDLDIGGIDRDSEPLTLGGGENETITLGWTTAESDVGNYTATVSSADDEDTASVQVLEPAFFDISIAETTSPVVANETLLVNATVTNTGEVEDTQTVVLEIGGSDRDSESLTLAGGENETITLEWATEEGDAGNYTALVSSDDNTGSAAIQVLEPAFFDISIVETTSPVVANETLLVNATVTNTGEVEDTQTITLETDGQLRDSDSLTLAGGASETVTLEWTTEEGDAGNYTALVSSDDETDSTEVRVLEPAQFVVSIDETNSPVVENETLLVNATVTNTGEVEDTQPIELETDGQPRDSDSLTLAGGASETVTLAWATGEGDAGNYTAVVSSDDETDSAAVQVLEPANFTVSLAETNSPVTVGDTLVVNATVTNEGEAEATRNVTLETDGTERDSTTLTLAGGANETVTLEWETVGGDDGNYTATVSSGDDSDDTSVEVLTAPYFAVSIDGTDGPVTEGDPLTVALTVTNTGGLEDTQNLTLEVDGSAVDAETRTLTAGGSAALNLTWNTSSGDAGNHTLMVASANETQSANVTVDAPPASPPPFSPPPPEPTPETPVSVTIDEVSDPVTAGSDLTVTAAVENLLETAETVTVTFLVDGSAVDSRSLSLEPGERVRSTFTAATTDADVGERTVTVRAGDVSASQTVTVETDEPAPTPSPTPPSDDTNETETDDPPEEPIEEPPEEPPTPIVPLLPEWTGEAIAYEPSPQTQHVGGFVWLTALVSALGSWVLVTRVTFESRVLAATLFLTAFRTATDVLHAAVDGLWAIDAPLAGFNVALELYISLTFLWFAALYADEHRLTDQRAKRAMLAVAAIATLAVVTNTYHSLVFVDFVHVSFPFAHVGAELGPVGWLLLALNVGLLLTGVALLCRTFLVGDRRTLRPVGVIAVGVTLALVLVAASLLERGPLPQYDYTAAGVAAFLVLTTATLLGHGLHRVKDIAQRSLLEELTDAIVVLDDAHAVIEHNAAAGELLPGIETGRPFDDLLEQSLSWPSMGETTTLEVTGADLDSGAAADDPFAPDGGQSPPSAQRHYLVQATPVGTVDTIGYTVRFADVTDLKQQAADLSRRNEQLDRFASTVTHDLRNPLTVATGYVDLLMETMGPDAERDTADRETVETSLEHIQSSLERMRLIIDDILALARSTESVTERYPLSFAAIVRSAWEGVDTNGATLTVEAEGTIQADRDRLQRLLENLFRNAVEHVGPDVSVVVGLTEGGFYVEDDGPGIPDAEREAIFEHGYSGQSNGTGLGLAIVEQLATAHGWTVRLDPDADGSRFVFVDCETTLEA
ncbi:CARDB domain-containing protein [Natronobiforma cellulositropha]|uniref:CARDB domain-containing protein n=1 Tax=Natronobiforma cellulositropha TaxID=1679076 RepID=UPI0021D58861|nr:CARDB domain-containing protein [Natronobiforma cellulositropha]